MPEHRRNDWTITVCPHHGTIALHLGDTSLRFTASGFHAFVDALSRASLRVPRPPQPLSERRALN